MNAASDVWVQSSSSFLNGVLASLRSLASTEKAETRSRQGYRCVSTPRRRPGTARIPQLMALRYSARLQPVTCNRTTISFVFFHSTPTESSLNINGLIWKLLIKLLSNKTYELICSLYYFLTLCHLCPPHACNNKRHEASQTKRTTELHVNTKESLISAALHSHAFSNYVYTSVYLLIYLPIISFFVVPLISPYLFIY